MSASRRNLDIAPDFCSQIITTRTYQERLSTLARVRQAGVTVCCGGIIGMGEDRAARYGLLRELSSLRPHPESVPVNLLVRVEGTPLADRPPEDPLELVRMIATAAYPDASHDRSGPRRSRMASSAHPRQRPDLYASWRNELGITKRPGLLATQSGSGRRPADC